MSANTEVTLGIVWSKYPCGEIWNGTITIGTFVSACATTTTATSTLFFPFMPGSAFVGWWGGYVVSNASTVAGTAVLTATDVNGNSATYTTPSIPAKGMFNASFLTAGDWTQNAANTANFDGSANYTRVGQLQLHPRLRICHAGQRHRRCRLHGGKLCLVKPSTSKRACSASARTTT